jgi:5-methylcytosine-specific restriction endonuclease McrA
VTFIEGLISEAYQRLKNSEPLDGLPHFATHAAYDIIEAEERASKRKPRGAKWFYNSVAWKQLRYRTLAENARRQADGKPRCELCGTGAEPDNRLNVDHIVPLSKDWSKRLDPTNVQCLCSRCNHGKLNRDDTDFRVADITD